MNGQRKCAIYICKSGGHYAQRNKPDTGQILHDAIYVRNLKQTHQQRNGLRGCGTYIQWSISHKKEQNNAI